MGKGFITIATGNDEYYRMARNLLQSYWHFCPNPLPFAILCDRENGLTDDFDEVLLFKEDATSSYLDKLALADYAPFEETIFIDADCLAFGDLNELFRFFENADDVSCFGRVLPLDDKTGWFEYEHLGELQPKVSYIVGLHGGVYYIRNTEKAKQVFNKARELIADYTKYRFKGKFNTPGDEPLVALAMALTNCRPIPFEKKAVCCYWEYEGNMELDISKGKASILSPLCERIHLVHWGMRFTRELEYKKQMELLDITETDGEDRDRKLKKCSSKYARLKRKERVRRFAEKIKKKMKRVILKR